MGTYSIGDPMMPMEDDQQFDDKQQAIEMAVARSYDDHVWAVWVNKTGEILALIFGQEVYTP